MAKYKVSVNEQRVIDGVSIPQYFNEKIVPYNSNFRKISAERPSSICPFHTDTDPSFHYWKDNKMFMCFGCHAAGNVVGMHMRWEKQKSNRIIDRNTAIRELAEMYGIELEVDEKGQMKTESVFDIAKKNLSIGNSGEKKEELTVSEFRTFNNQLKNQIKKMPYVDGERASQLYYKLDLTLSSYLAERKEQKVQE